jgi:hypothetical protein
VVITERLPTRTIRAIVTLRTSPQVPTGCTGLRSVRLEDNLILNRLSEVALGLYRRPGDEYDEPVSETFVRSGTPDDRAAPAAPGL